jgi:hypothetical protein
MCFCWGWTKERSPDSECIEGGDRREVGVRGRLEACPTGQ